MLSFGTPIKVKAIFNKAKLAKFALTTSTSGAPGGSVECKINGGSQGSCPTEVEEQSKVEVIAGGTGVEVEEWSGVACEGGNTGSTCSFTMPAEAVSANAKFKVASENLAVTEAGGGTGSVACEVNGTAQSCNGTYKYGDAVKVKATPAVGSEVESITGSGCKVEGEGESSSGTCEFTLTANSSVTVVFESAGTKAVVTGTTPEGKVNRTTELSGCGGPVDMGGPFIPGVAFAYKGSCLVTATTTGLTTVLSAKDGGAHEGFLENNTNADGPYYLKKPLETRATGGSFAPLNQRSSQEFPC